MKVHYYDRKPNDRSFVSFMGARGLCGARGLAVNQTTEYIGLVTCDDCTKLHSERARDTAEES